MFSSYLEHTEDKLFNDSHNGQSHRVSIRERQKVQTNNYTTADGRPMVVNDEAAARSARQQAQNMMEIGKMKDDLDVQIANLTEQLVMLQYPHPGNLRSSKKKEVRARLRCIQHILLQREQSSGMREQYNDKIRRLDMDNNILEGKVAKLQKQLLDKDRQSYQTELRAKEQMEEAQKIQKQSLSDMRGQAGQRSKIETELQKSQLELRRSKNEIEKLKQQLNNA